VRRILASLFVIGALLAGGVFATGAWFSTSVTAPGVVFTAGATNFDVSLVQGDQNISKLGPGWSKSVCVKIVNEGDFALNMTQKIVATSGSGGLYGAVELLVRSADASCTPTGVFNDWSALSNYNNLVLPIGSIGFPGTAYVLEDLRWIANDTDQNTLKGLKFTLDVTINGQTP
jgi:hypothetical protein